VVVGVNVVVGLGNRVGVGARPVHALPSYHCHSFEDTGDFCDSADDAFVVGDARAH
tara:strand:- start:150 stop:317 length:168 start_codon:yes stop_codon:yes gene_type:complete